MKRYILVLQIVLLTLSATNLFAVNGNLGNGSGTCDNPYLIEDFNDFHVFCNNINYWGGHIRLNCNLDLDPALPGRQIYSRAVIAPDAIGSSSSSFEGISFTGHFNGNDKRITGLNIAGGETGYNIGLFGKIGGGGEVYNLVIENATIAGNSNLACLAGVNCGSIINCYGSGEVSGTGHSVGGLVGINYVSIVNCYANVNSKGIGESIAGTGGNVGGLVGVNLGSIVNSYANGNVNGTHSSVGGLVGLNKYGNIRYCYSTGDVTNLDCFTGGLTGYNYYGDISYCYSIGDVTCPYRVGGLVGYNYFANISNCYSTGEITGSEDVGGLVGCNSSYSIIMNSYSSGSVTGSKDVGGLLGANIGYVTNCYSSGLVTGSSKVGGLVGNCWSGKITKCFWDVNTSAIGISGDDNYGATGKTMLELKDIDTFLDAGWDFVGEIANGTSQIWQMSIEDCYPMLSYFNGYIPIDLRGDGSETNPYLIGDALELGTIYYYSNTACYKLIADIDLEGIQWSYAIMHDFCGHFDGDGHIIYNLNIDGTGYLGFFDTLDNNAIVTDLGLENVTISGSGEYVGGLVGQNSSGNITNCCTTGSVNSLDRYVGGLVGRNFDGNITNSYSTASAISSSYLVGSLAGGNTGNIINCYSTGDVDGSNSIGGLVGGNTGYVANCYSTGHITKRTQSSGGLVGNGNAGSVNNCFWDVDTSGIGTSGDDNWGAIGKTSIEMNDANTFLNAGWDYVGEIANGEEDVWYVWPYDYPRLKGVGIDPMVFELWYVKSKIRVGRSEFEYKCKLNIYNSTEADFHYVEAKLNYKANDPNCILQPISILDDTVTAMVIGSGQTILTMDTITVRIDRSVPINQGCLSWDVTFEKNDGRFFNTSIKANLTDFEACYYDVGDFIVMCQEWLSSGETDIRGPQGSPDGIVNFYDFAALAIESD